MSLEQWMDEVRYQLQENRTYQRRHESARQRIHPATWAHQAATVYAFINMVACGLEQPIDAMALAAEAPSLLFVHPDRFQDYLERITGLDLRLPPECRLYTYDHLLSTPAPARPGLLIVENANELLANLAQRNKSVSHFYRWSVGDGPLPNCHTHLILQPH